jgi:hypothetical protein
MTITEAGKYQARCIDDPSSIRWGRAKSGAEQIALTFAIIDSNGEPTVSTMEYVGSFGSQQSAEIALKALRVCGWQGDDILDLRGINANVVELDVQWDEYQNERRLRIKWLNRPGAGRIAFRDSLDDRAKQALARRIRGLAAGLSQSASATKSSKNPVDDLPF